jgi:2-oxo-3-hexenedioate decarboxylase
VILREDIRQIAKQLIIAKEHVQIVAQPSKKFEGFDLQDGYHVGVELQKYREEQGFKPIGRKIGFTNRDTWKEFNLNTPIWAPVYDKTVIYADRNSLTLPLREMVAPRIEPEIVFKLRKSVIGNDYADSIDKLLGLIEWVAIGFEIVDCHFPNWEFSAADAIADFGVHAMLVIGAQRELAGKNYDFRKDQLCTFEAVLRKDQNVVAVGRGENALGSPLIALNYLVKVLSQQDWAEPIQAGEVVTTGTLTPLPYIYPRENWCVEPIGIDLEALELRFS